MDNIESKYAEGSELYNSLSNFTKAHYKDILAQRSYFIEQNDYDKATFFQWLLSKGTSFECYVRYANQNIYTDEDENNLYFVNYYIDYARTVFYAMLKPLQSQFFYWTILLLIMYKFNTKRPVIKLVLYHYIFRTMGDIVEKLGDLLSIYHGLDKNGNCLTYLEYTEQHPLKWFLTRQINSFFWYTGEIIGDWYPLIRTKAVAKNGRSIKLVYIFCILFNITKIAVPISQIFLSPTSLYVGGKGDNYGKYNYDHVNEYYNYYWLIQALVIIASLLYDFAVFIVLKKELFNKVTSEYGFIKKFRLISEYRIFVSCLIAIIGLPIALFTSITKIVTFKTKWKGVNFSIEDFRIVVTNVQYMIIFIDQILLLNSRNDSSGGKYTCTSSECSCPACKNNSFNSGNLYNDYDDYDNGKVNKTYYVKNGKNGFPSINRNYIRTNTTQNSMLQYGFSDISRIKLNNNNNYNNYY